MEILKRGRIKYSQEDEVYTVTCWKCESRLRARGSELIFINGNDILYCPVCGTKVYVRLSNRQKKIRSRLYMIFILITLIVISISILSWYSYIN